MQSKKLHYFTGFMALALCTTPMDLKASSVNLLKSWHNAPPSYPKRNDFIAPVGTKNTSQEQEESASFENSTLESSQVLPQDQSELIEQGTAIEEQALEIEPTPEKEDIILTEITPPVDPIEAPMQATPLEMIKDVTNPVSHVDVIQIQSLEPVQEENVGLLDEASGGLPRDIWKGSSLKDIETQFAQLPEHYQNHAFYQLALRLLLSTFEFPRSTGNHDLISIRAKKLWQMGHAKEACHFMNYDQNAQNLDLKNQILYEKLIHESDLEQATRLAESSFALNPNLYWEKAVIFCRLQNHHEDQAQLSLSLFEETHPQEEFFIAIVKSILEKSPYTRASISLHQLSFQDLILLAQAKGELSKEDLETIKPAYIPIVLKQAEKLRISYENQLCLWERLCECAPKYKEDLIKIYSTMPAEHLEGIKKAILASDQENSILLKDSPLVRACLFQLFEASADLHAKLTLAEELMHNGIQNNKLGIVSALLAPSIAKIQASKANASWAALAITALSLGKVKDAAKYWCPYVQDLSNVVYIPFVLNLCGTKQQNLKKILDYLEKESNQGTHLAPTYIILEEMGTSIPADYWDRLKEEAPNPALSLKYKMALKKLTEDKHVGETLAYILKVFGGTQDTLSSEAIQIILSSLKKVGLANEARNLALWSLGRQCQ